MTNISQVPMCEKCGNQMEVRREGSTQGLFCTNCDWSVVTTYIPELKRDDTLYEVSITSGDYRNEQHVKTVAQVAGVNFLAARKLLQGQSPFVVFRGTAIKVVEVQEVLNLASLVYQIAPKFPW